MHFVKIVFRKMWTDVFVYDVYVYIHTSCTSDWEGVISNIAKW